MQASTATLPSLAEPLLAWYDRHARELPWRSPPHAPLPEPYRVWLSEVMLQQTTVAAVTPRFLRFIERWPTVDQLAAAEEAEVMAEWAGLGYYRRARSLIACARVVAARGGFPDSEQGLRELPGIGAYTAAAIAAIAFGKPAVVVDGNVERVVARLFAVAEPLPGAARTIRDLAGQLTPPARPGDYAQAVMDLGATVCTPRKPRCPVCPLAVPCRARASDLAETYPRKAAKPERPLRRGRAFWIERAGKVWLVRRKGGGMLGGMRALPDDSWNARSDGEGTAPLAAAWRQAGCVHHSFTHFRLQMDVLRCRAQADAKLLGGEWWPIDRLDAAGLPTVFAQAARLAIAMGEGAEA